MSFSDDGQLAPSRTQWMRILPDTFPDTLAPPL